MGLRLRVIGEGKVGDPIMFPPRKLIPQVLRKLKLGKTKEDETTQSIHSLANNSLASDRMALVTKKRKDRGMADDVILHLNKANRDSTSRMYNSAWQKYADWCKENHYEPETYDTTKQILSFLHAFSHFSPSTLNGYRSSIASVLKVLYPESMPIAKDPDVMAFFRAKRQYTTSIIIPTTTRLVDLVET